MMKTFIHKTLAFLRSPRAETLRYIIVGGCTTLVDYASYQLMIVLLHMGVTVSNILSTTLAILFAYVTNKLFVFGSRTAGFAEFAAEFVRFIVSRLFTMVLEIGGVYLFVNVFGQDYRLGKGEAIIIVIIINYVLSKLLVFKKNPDKKAQ